MIPHCGAWPAGPTVHGVQMTVLLTLHGSPHHPQCWTETHTAVGPHGSRLAGFNSQYPLYPTDSSVLLNINKMEEMTHGKR